jgi:endonuclease YncB( thermonuclease family)
MRPGSLGRNLIVAVLYFAFIGLWPLVVGYYVGRNRSGTAEKLSWLPGVSESGGLLAGIVVAIGGYLLLLTIVGAGAILDTGTDTAADGADIESTSDDVANQPSESSGSDTDSTSEQTGGNTPEETDTSSATADGGGDATSSDSSDGTSDGDTNSGGDSDESNNTVTVEVVDVVDGDTMDIEYENGTDDTVRLIGVDTPEVYTDVSPEEYEGVPNTGPARQCLNRYGDEASAFAEQELASETVQLRFDPLSDRRGSFDRLLVYIMYDGENFNHLLIDKGLARVYDSTFTDSERFYDTEASEQENQTGVWSCRNAGDGDGESDGGGDSDGGSRLHRSGRTHA